MTNAWVLGIVDVTSSAEAVTRSLSCWVHDSRCIWTRDGTAQSCTLPDVRRDAADRIEFEVMPMGSSGRCLRW
jgi:hypothetical protein